MQTHDFLRELHRILQPRGYLEVGVFRGHSLAMATCPAVGIDPAPQIDVELPDTTRVVATTSDEFFASAANRSLIPRPLDLALVDGLHHREQAARDLCNIAPHMAPGGLIVLDDVLPREQAEAGREPVVSAWAGDVWKLVDRYIGTDLDMTLVDTEPTGCAIIRAERAWMVSPDPIVRSDTVPDWILRREGVDAPEDVLRWIE